MAIELIPPTNPTHYELWAMGFGKRERDKIIDIGVVLFRNPIGLGQFICRTNYVPATKIKAIMAEMAKVLDK